MIKVILAIILVPFAVAALAFTGCLLVGIYKGIRDSLRNRK